MNTRRCDICETAVKWEHDQYDGQLINRYDMFVCMPCWDGNWDGWNPRWEKRFEEHLAKKGIPLPERNAKGWYPRAF
jgi:hypothetical protein